MAKITVGELLVRCFAAEGIDLMCGIIDGAHIPVVVHTARYGMRYVNARHEEAAVHLAEGYARIAHKPAVVIGNPACGTGNLIAGLVSAYGEGHPVIALGTTRSRLRADPNRGGAWQAADNEAMARPLTKYCATIRQWERVPEMVRAAFRAALTGRPGPVFLAIADELLATAIDDDQLPAILPPARYRVTDMGAGDPDAIERAAEALARAQRPFVHAGKGVLWSRGAGELLALADHLQAGMSATLGARGVVPEDHSRYFHPFDLAGAGAARREADVVLVVGARLGEYDGWGVPPTWGDPATQTTIQIDADPLSIGLNRPVDVALVADARRALAALLERVRGKSAARAEMAGLARYREQSAGTMAQGIEYLTKPGEGGLNPGQMMLEVRARFPRDAITVLDGGNTTLTGVAYHPIYVPDGFLYSVKMGYLGTGLPFALGARLAAPGRPVCAVVGDGAFGFHVMELETAVRESLPVVVVVAVDDAWGMEKSAFGAWGYGEAEWAGRGIDMARVRYDEIAQAMGCHGEWVQAQDELGPALERAIASGKPAVVHVQVDHELNTRPPGWEQFRQARSSSVY